MGIGRRGTRGAVSAPGIGRAQIIQAHAPTPGAAPLIHANASHAPLASIIQAPHGSGGGGGGRWFGAPPTPKDRHDKLSGGRAGQSSPTATADTPWSVERDRYGGLKVGIRDADGNLTNVKRVTKGEYDAVVGRGAAGANLDPVSLAIYRHHTGWKSDEEKAQEVKLAEERRKAAAAQATAEQKHKYNMEMQAAKDKAAAERANARSKETSGQKEKDREAAAARQQAAIDAANNRAMELQKEREAAAIREENRKYGIPDDAQISNEDRAKMRTGKYNWGYTDAQQKEIDSLWANYNEKVSKGEENPEDLAAAKKQIEERIAAMPKSPILKPGAEAVEDLNGRTTTLTDGNGNKIFGYVDKNGGFVPVQPPKPQRDLNTPTFDDYQKWKKSRDGVQGPDGEQADTSVATFRKEWNEFHAPQSGGTNEPTIGTSVDGNGLLQTTIGGEPIVPGSASASTASAPGQPAAQPTPAPTTQTPAAQPVAAKQPIIGGTTGTDWSQFEDDRKEEEE